MRPERSRQFPGARAGRRAWFISVLVHGCLIAALAKVGWPEKREYPVQQFTAGIAVQKRDSQIAATDATAAGAVPREDPSSGIVQLLSNVEPPALDLPGLPQLDATALGLAGAPLIKTDEAPIIPADDAASAMVSTQFFGAQVWGSTFVYVIDRSGSMSERDRLDAAKRELVASLAQLLPDSRFQIIFYNEQRDVVLHPDSVQLHCATDENKLMADRELKNKVADGGAAHLPALELALSLRPDVVFFLTDADDLRAHDVQRITELNRDWAKICAVEFGVGAEQADRTSQLRELAQRNGGIYRYIDTARFDAAGEDEGK
jgi:hypothetical protein